MHDEILEPRSLETDKYPRNGDGLALDGAVVRLVGPYNIDTVYGRAVDGLIRDVPGFKATHLLCASPEEVRWLARMSEFEEKIVVLTRELTDEIAAEVFEAFSIPRDQTDPEAVRTERRALLAADGITSTAQLEGISDEDLVVLAQSYGVDISGAVSHGHEVLVAAFVEMFALPTSEPEAAPTDDAPPADAATTAVETPRRARRGRGE